MGCSGAGSDDNSTGDSSDPCENSPTLTTEPAELVVEPLGEPTWTMPSDEATFSSPSLAGCYGFDRSDPETGIANIMEAVAAVEATATCIYEALGDVANVSPAKLRPEFMTFKICQTSIFQLMTGDPRFTGSDG